MRLICYYGVKKRAMSSSDNKSKLSDPPRCRHKFQPRYDSALTLVETLKTLADKLLSDNCPAEIWAQFNKVVTQYRKTKIYVYDICVKCGETRKDSPRL